jgi:hypothetical protein
MISLPNPTNDYLAAYRNSVERRIHDPGLTDEGYVVKSFTDRDLNIVTAHSTLYDAIREVNVQKEYGEYKSKIVLYYFSPRKVLMEPVKTWEYFIDGSFNAAGTYVVKEEGWKETKHYRHQSKEKTTMEFTEKELSTLRDMVQTYVELQEEIYGPIPDKTTTFTKTQIKLFEILGVE